MARADRLPRNGSLSFCLRDQQHIETDETIIAQAVVHLDRTVEIHIAGPFHKTFVFREPAPAARNGITVSLAWSRDEIKLYINGRFMRTLRIEDAVENTTQPETLDVDVNASRD